MLSISPANRLMVGIAFAPPLVMTTGFCEALKNPVAVAKIVYVPAGACRVKVPSGLTSTEAASVLSALYKLTVTSLLASTCPFSEQTGKGVGDASGVNVNVGVGDTSGVNVKVGVGDSAGRVEVAVADPSGVEVAVAEPSGVEVAVADPSGVEVAVAEPSGVEVAVSDPPGVEVTTGVGDSIGVAVGATPTTVTLAAPVDGSVVRRLSP